MNDFQELYDEHDELHNTKKWLAQQFEIFMTIFQE